MKKILMGCICAVALCAVAETRIATVNMIDLLRCHPSHESNKALVKSTDADYKAKLEKQQEGARAIMEEARKIQEDMNNPMLSPKAKGEIQKKLEGVAQRFQAAQQELRVASQHYQSELNDLESRLIKIETDEIRGKIKGFAAEKGFDLIVDSTMMAFASEKLDVTDEILKLMNVDPAKRAEKKNEGK